MTRLDPGPAPTLLNDWVTNQAFWGFLFLAAFAGLVYYTTEFLKRWHAKSAELDRVLTEGPPDDTCAIGDCTRYAAVLFPSSTGVMFVCRFHAAQVSEWTGPALFDQEDGVA